MAAAAAWAGANKVVSETPGSGLEAGSDPGAMPGWTAGGTREEASLGVSSSSGVEWSRAED